MAAACAAQLGVLAAIAPAQTNTMAVPPPTIAAPVAPVQINGAAAVSPTNMMNQTATTPATNTVSLLESLRTDPAFQSYSNLVEHSLFVPSSEIGGVSGASDVGPTFAGGLRVTGFYKRGNDIQASIEDRTDPDKKLFVHVGDTIADTEIKVVGFDLQGRAVLLKKGDEEGRLEYESEAMPPPASNKPGAPGVPAPPGMQGPPRPGVAPLPTPPAATANARPGAPPSAATSAAADAANRVAARKQQRLQTITRLQQTLQTTTDPAARQRLQNYIQMLEKANAQE
jgi:hypothetical protein